MASGVFDVAVDIIWLCTRVIWRLVIWRLVICYFAEVPQPKTSLLSYNRNPDIIESVDSNVGIARTRNIWQYIKISPNLKNGELISLYDNILFIFECFHDQQDSQWRKKASRKYSTKQQQKLFFFFFFFFLSSDGLAQYCVNLSRWFTHETAAFSTEQCTTPPLFHNFEASQGACSHSNTTASNLGRHFLYLYLRMRT